MNKIKFLILLIAGLAMMSCEDLLNQTNPNAPDSDSYWKQRKMCKAD